MKCPNCGNNKYLKIDSPIYVKNGGCTECNDCYACSECGYVIFFDKRAPIKYKEQNDKNAKIKEEIAAKTALIMELEKRINDTTSYKTELKKQKKRLKQLDELGLDGKERRATLEAIFYYEESIGKGINKEVQGSINQLNSEISNLKNDIREEFKETGLI